MERLNEIKERLDQDEIERDDMEWLVEQVERVGMLEKMLSDTLDDIQIIRDNSNRTHSSLDSAVRNYFMRVKEVNSVYMK